MTKKNSKILFFSFFFIIIIQTLFVIPIYGNAETTNLSISSNWLSVQTSGFVDLSPNKHENDLYTEIGGYDLIEFENLGLLLESTTDDLLVYGGKITFGFEMTALTTVDYSDMYPNINIDYKRTVPFFALVRAQLFASPVSLYSLSYREVNYGDTYVPHEYNGYIPLTVSMKELTMNTGSMTIGGETLDTPEFIFDVMGVDTKIIRSDVVGEYEDRFIDINNIDEGKVNFNIQTDLFPTQTKVVKYMNDAGIGWRAGSVEEGQTLQRYIVYGGGGTYQNTNPNIDKEFTFNVNMKLKPSAYEYVQYNDITKAGVLLWEWGFFSGNLDISYGPTTQRVKRVVAVHVVNYMIHWDYSVDVLVYATIPSNAELTKTILSDPYLKFGDFIWDTSITGDYKVEVPITAGAFLLGILPWLIIIVVIVIIILVVYFYMKRKKNQNFRRQPAIHVNINK